MEAIVMAIPEVATRTGRPVIIVGGLAVVGEQIAGAAKRIRVDAAGAAKMFTRRAGSRTSSPEPPKSNEVGANPGPALS